MRVKNEYINDYLIEVRETFGRRLTEVMEFRGYTRTEIREILKTKYNYPINRQAFAKYQRGEVWIPEDFAHCVANILGISPWFFLNPRITDETFENWKRDQRFRAEFVDFLEVKDKELRAAK